MTTLNSKSEEAQESQGPSGNVWDSANAREQSHSNSAVPGKVLSKGHVGLDDLTPEDVKSISELFAFPKKRSRDVVEHNEVAPRRSVTPPLSARFVLKFLLSARDVEAVLGDNQEQYADMSAEFGKRAADIWYWKQVLLSLWPLLTRAAKKLVEWGVIGWISHLLHRTGS